MNKQAGGRRAYVYGIGLVAIAACARSEERTNVAPGVGEASSPLARVLALRDRFPVLRAPAVEASAAPARARVLYPAHADGMVRLEVDATPLTVGFSLRAARSVDGVAADGMLLYPGAFDGADVVHRMHGDGTEDYLVFEARPATEEIVYDIDVTSVAGLRLVANTMEFLDPSGAPRVRVAPPYVIDARGQRGAATLRLEGCAFDPSAAAPWGRPVTAAAATTCAMHVNWHASAYPALVDPAWSTTFDMTAGRAKHTATTLGNGKVLVAGGTFVSSAELFDPASKTWAATGSMATLRGGHMAALLPSGKVLVAGGFASGDLDTAEVYDPATGTFTATGTMSVTRTQSTATSLASGKVLIVGAGVDPAERAELYDETTSLFARTAGFAIASRSQHTATLLPSGKVLLAGGTGDSTAETYDPAADAFAATIGPMATVRAAHAATALADGRVLLTGGSGSGSAEIFDPASGLFTANVSPMTAVRAFHTATTLLSGKVLLVGGEDLASAEIFDPVVGTFTATLASVARSDHTASLVSGGAVLAAGGRDGNYGGLKDSRVFSDLERAAPCLLDAECSSGFCVDGVCCDRACGSQCEACDRTDAVGTCTPIVGAPHAQRAACAGAAPCQGACNGERATDCEYPALDIACGSTCNDGMVSPSACDGLGGCVAGASASCNGLVCADASVCKSACVVNADCVAGTACRAGSCTTGTVCTDDHTEQTAGSPPRDCGAYRCAGACKSSCVSVDDCTVPNVCNLDGACAPALAESQPASAGTEDGGCSTSQGAAHRSWWPLGLLALLVVRKRQAK